MKLWPIIFLGALSFSCARFNGDLRYKKIKNVYYTDVKSERQKGDLYLPDSSGEHPGVILVHGGGWSSRDLTDMNSIAESLASHGFVVFNINYRLAPEFKHPTPIEDLESAVIYLRKNAQTYLLSKDDIGLWGYSSGGHTVSQYALTRSDNPELRVNAVIAGGTPFDLTWYTRSPYLKSYIGKYRDEAFDEYIEASPIFKITQNSPAFFIYHAVEDKLVEHSQATSFEARLKIKGIPVEREEIEFWGHKMAFVYPNAPVEKGVKFLKKRLVLNSRRE